MPPPKKSLGQCFLVERQYAQQAAAALGIHGGDHVIEIGPGRGILTAELLQSGARVTGVEIDARLIAPLQQRWGDEKKFTLHAGDFLEFRFADLPAAETLKVAGNLPYHLAGEIIYRLLTYARAARRDPQMPWVETAVLMMQKEVAERVAARPGGKTWGKLSVFAQLEADVQLMFTVPANAFRPTPKVDGGVVRFDYLRIPRAYPLDVDLLERMVRRSFQQRRKMLKSSLFGLAGVHPHWQAADLDFTRRPETLSPGEWARFADAVSAAQNRSGGGRDDHG